MAKRSREELRFYLCIYDLGYKLQVGRSNKKKLINRWIRPHVDQRFPDTEVNLRAPILRVVVQAFVNCWEHPTKSWLIVTERSLAFDIANSWFEDSIVNSSLTLEESRIRWIIEEITKRTDIPRDEIVAWIKFEINGRFDKIVAPRSANKPITA